VTGTLDNCCSPIEQPTKFELIDPRWREGAAWLPRKTELEQRILRAHRGGTGILKIGKALRVGTGTVQRVLMEQPRPFDSGVAVAAYAPQCNGVLYLA
jgi:hypothetical protein